MARQRDTEGPHPPAAGSESRGDAEEGAELTIPGRNRRKLNEAIASLPGAVFMLLRYLNIIFLFASALLSAGCASRGVSVDSSPPSITPQVVNCHILSGEWEYIDGTGAAVLLTLDEQGNGHYEWKDGRFETHRLVDHTWSGMWFQEENDRDGGFTVEFSPDFSEGEDNGGTAASEAIMPRPKRAERFT